MALKRYSRQMEKASAVWMPSSEPVLGSILTLEPSEVRDSLEYLERLSERVGGLLGQAENPKEAVLPLLNPREQAILEAAPLGMWPEAIVYDLDSVKARIGDALEGVKFPIKTGRNGRQLRDAKAVDLQRWMSAVVSNPDEEMPSPDLLTTKRSRPTSPQR
jgi:hypothetical protein